MASSVGEGVSEAGPVDETTAVGPGVCTSAVWPQKRSSRSELRPAWKASSLSLPKAQIIQCSSPGVEERVSLSVVDGARGRVKVIVVPFESWVTDSSVISWSSNGITPDPVTFCGKGGRTSAIALIGSVEC